MNYPPNPQDPLSTSKTDNNAVTGLRAGTLVTTPDGDKKIEEVVEGDLVLSGLGTGLCDFCEVKQVKETPYRGPILRITSEASADDYLEFCATSNQVCFALRPTEKPRENSVVLIAFDSYQGHAIYSKKEGELETYIDAAEAIAFRMSVSNGGAEIERFAGFGLPKSWNRSWAFRFMPATALNVGMEVPTFNIYGHFLSADIRYIEEEPYDGLIYTLDIPKVRNFAANGILVHDSALVQF